MATIALATVHRDITRRRRKLTVSGLPAGIYTPGGITLDWTTTKNPKLLPLGIPASNPNFGEITNAPAGYSGELIQGTTIKNWLLKIFTAPGTEMTAIAIPAALLADPFVFEISGPIGSF